MVEQATATGSTEGAGGHGNPPPVDVYQQLISRLDASGARYRVIEHPPEGRTHTVSTYRGHPVAQAAKCIVVMVKVGKREKRYFLAVVPGDQRVDLQALRLLVDGTYVTFASQEAAESLSGSRSTILPFSAHPDLDLVVDPGLLKHPVIFFNAGRLDRSLALDTRDYVQIAQPRVHPIAAPHTEGKHDG